MSTSLKRSGLQKALLPAQKAAMMDEDLKFAAAMIMDGGDKIRQLRKQAIKADVCKHR